MKTNPVTGLLLYSYYSSLGNTLTFFMIALITGFVMMLTGNSALFLAVTIFWITCFSSSFMMSVDKENQSKWTRFQLALPVRRKEVIASKYLGHFLFLFVGIIFAGIFVGGCFFIHPEGKRNIIESIDRIMPVCIGGSFVSCAVFYPLYYTIGASNGEVLSMICMVAGLGVNALLMVMGILVGLPEIVTGGLCIIISVLLFIVSYIVSSKLYARKDF